MADIFISYSRKDKDFVRKLHAAVEQDGRDAWVDWDNIPLTAEWLEEIYAGIEAANSFAYVISPDSVRSEICGLELAHALELNKRLVPILHRELIEKHDQAALHPSISSHNWLFFRDQDNFDEAYGALRTALDTDLEHLQMHTRLLVRAVEWNDRERDGSLVLRGNELKAAQQWLARSADKQPAPTELHREYIEVSQRAATARQRVVVLTAIYGLVVLALAIFAFAQAITAENERRKAESQRQIAVTNEQIAVEARATSDYNAVQAQSLALASNAQQALYRDAKPEVAVALALEANSIDEPSPLAQSILAQAAYFPGMRIVLEGFADYGSRVAISPDGHSALSATAGFELVQWDLTTGEPLQRWSFGEVEVQTVAFSPDGRLAAATSADGLLLVYELESGEQVLRAPGLGSRDIVFMPDSQQILVGLINGELRLVSVSDGTVTGTFRGHRGVVRGVAVSADGSRIASSSEDGTVRVWDTESGQVLAVLNANAGEAWAVAMTSDGQRVLVGYLNETLVLWDVESREPVHVLEGHTNRVWDVVIAHDDVTAISTSYDGVVIQWDLETGEPVRRFLGHTTRVYGVDISPDGAQVISGSWDGTVRLWDLNNGAELRRLAAHEDSIWDVAFYPLESDVRMAISAGRDGQLIQWNLDTGEIINSFGDEDVIYLDVEISPDGRRVLTAGDNNMVSLWDWETGELLQTMRGHISWVSSVNFSPDGNTAISGSDDRSLILWDLETGVPIRHFRGHTGRIWDVTFTPDGRYVLSAATDETLILWDVFTGEIVRVFRGHGGAIYKVDVSSDGLLAISASEDQTLRLWDLQTGEALRRFDGHTSDVRTVAFSPDNLFVLSGSNDASVRIWDVSTGGEILRLDGHTDVVLSAIYSASGNSVLTGSQDRTVRYWRVVSISDLIVWTYENRYVPEFTCEQRVIYRVARACDADGLFPTVTPYLTATPQPTPTPTATPEAEAQAAAPSATPTLQLTPVPPAAVAGEYRGEVPRNGFDVVQYVGRAGETLNIEVLADNPANGASDEEQVATGLMDTIMVVFAPDGSILAYNDDAPGSTGSDSALYGLELPADGIYLIEIHTYTPHTGGEYTLIIEPVVPEVDEEE